MSALHKLKATLSSWQRRARERHELAQLDPWTQRDLGSSANDLEREASKPRWCA